MFRNDLEQKLKAIFGFQKVTYDAPSEVFEQDTLFIEIQNVSTRASDGRAFCRVNGSVIVYSQNNKLPYGYFQKRLGKVEPALTKDLFFFDFDTDIASSGARVQNIVERRLRFVFLYSQQYDPARGSMTDVSLEVPVYVNSGDGLVNAGNGKILKR